MQNCVKEPFAISSLHGKGTAPESLASKLFGSRIGRVHEGFVLRAGQWIMLLVIVSEVVDHVGTGIGAITKSIAGTAHLLLCAAWGPSLHTPTLKQLGKVAGCWYYVSAAVACGAERCSDFGAWQVIVLCAGGVCAAVKKANQSVSFQVHCFLYTCSLLMCLPGMDVRPFRFMHVWCECAVCKFCI